VLDGDPEHSHLLEFALNEETFSDTTIMFTVSMTTPWAMLEQLQNWATLLQDHIDKLNLSADFIQERKQAGRLLKNFPDKYNFCLSDEINIYSFQ